VPGFQNFAKKYIKSAPIKSVISTTKATKATMLRTKSTNTRIAGRNFPLDQVHRTAIDTNSALHVYIAGYGSNGKIAPEELFPLL